MLSDWGDCVRTQVPLVLAWALTIHGSSLDRVIVNAHGAFEGGQVYVALSRARSMEGLEIRGFDARRVRAHPMALGFYNALNLQSSSSSSSSSS